MTIESKTLQIVYNRGDRVVSAFNGRKGTIRHLFSDLAMVRWDDAGHPSDDPMAYDQIAPMPAGWDHID